MTQFNQNEKLIALVKQCLDNASNLENSKKEFLNRVSWVCLVAHYENNETLLKDLKERFFKTGQPFHSFRDYASCAKKLYEKVFIENSHPVKTSASLKADILKAKESLYEDLPFSISYANKMKDAKAKAPTKKEKEIALLKELQEDKHNPLIETARELSPEQLHIECKSEISRKLLGVDAAMQEYAATAAIKDAEAATKRITAELKAMFKRHPDHYAKVMQALEQIEAEAVDNLAAAEAA